MSDESPRLPPLHYDPPVGAGARSARVLLALSPAVDEAFRNHVEAALRADMPRTADELQRAIRYRYPQAVVRRRDLAHETVTVWYVYRDGHWVPSGSAPAHEDDRDDRPQGR